MASTLIYGAMDAVLVDTFMTAKQANDLADWVEAKGKNLTTIYMGVALILDIDGQAARTGLRSGRSVSSIAGPHRSLRARHRSCTMC